jgi:hypothetical protein
MPEFIPELIKANIELPTCHPKQYTEQWREWLRGYDARHRTDQQKKLAQFAECAEQWRDLSRQFTKLQDEIADVAIVPREPRMGASAESALHRAEALCAQLTLVLNEAIV